MSFDLATASATVNGAGVATVTIGPGGAHESWRVQSISVLLSGSGTLLGEARVYLGGSAVASSFLEGTYDGARDTSPQTTDLVLHPGDLLTIQWTGATVGAVATANVRYSRGVL